MQEFKGEKKWTRYIKDMLEEVFNTDEDLKNSNYRISCDSDENKMRVSASISLNKYLKMINEDQKEDISIEDFSNNNWHPDILIEEEIRVNDRSYYIPRLMIESKYYGSSAVSHEFIAYNHKADLHKRLYSGLRYGLIIANSRYIPNSAIQFGQNFDFILSLKEDPTEEEKERFINVVKKNLTYSKNLEFILDSSSKKKETLCVCIENNIVFKNEEK